MRSSHAENYDSKDIKSSVAVLYQAIQPPIIDGIRKPMKPGGYSDSGADIAYNLRALNIPVVTPVLDADPARVFDWVFPDTEEGIQAALAKGANVLWANTIVFSGHPLEQLASRSDLSIVGQIPSLTQKYDDKWVTNEELKSQGLTVAPSCLLSQDSASSSHTLNLRDLSAQQLSMRGLEFPLVVKPVRGRGSQGVYVVQTFADLKQKIDQLLAETEIVDGQSFTKYGLSFIIEQYLPRQEVTVTVMPPGTYNIKGQAQVKDYWSLPIVKRFNHVNGIAPYNGVVAVVNNSSLLNEIEMRDPRYAALQRECEQAAKIVDAKSIIRIDCREGREGKFYLFDLNMKPNLTGPGRPGRADQDSLCSLSARSEEIHWSYGELLLNMCAQRWPADIMLKIRDCDAAATKYSMRR